MKKGKATESEADQPTDEPKAIIKLSPIFDLLSGAEQKSAIKHLNELLNPEKE